MISQGAVATMIRNPRKTVGDIVSKLSLIRLAYIAASGCLSSLATGPNAALITAVPPLGCAGDGIPS